MYSYNKLLGIIDKAKDLIYKYKNQYDRLSNKMEIQIQDKYYSKRTIHNIKESIRPDLVSINYNMIFFDFSNSWRKKKQRLYRINKNIGGEIQCINVGNDYIEFWIYEGDCIILVDYSLNLLKNDFALESVGCGSFINGRIDQFFVAEVYCFNDNNVDFRLRCEQYEYSNNKLSSVTTYVYHSMKRITVDSKDNDKLGYIKLGNGNGIEANPEVYFDEFLYNENNCLYQINRYTPYNENVGVAKIIIKNAK